MWDEKYWSAYFQGSATAVVVGVGALSRAITPFWCKFYC